VSDEAKSTFERHAQTILSMLVLAALSWAGAKLLDMSERQARMEIVQLQILEQQKTGVERDRELDKRLRDVEMMQAQGRK
jgi:hypothetical protein